MGQKNCRIQTSKGRGVRQERLVHKSLYDMHATRASRRVHSQGANLVQIVSSFNLHFSSADRVPSTGTKGAGEIPVAKFKAKGKRNS